MRGKKTDRLEVRVEGRVETQHAESENKVKVDGKYFKKRTLKLGRYYTTLHMEVSQEEETL